MSRKTKVLKSVILDMRLRTAAPGKRLGVTRYAGTNSEY